MVCHWGPSQVTASGLPARNPPSPGPRKDNLVDIMTCSVVPCTVGPLLVTSCVGEEAEAPGPQSDKGHSGLWTPCLIPDPLLSVSVGSKQTRQFLDHRSQDWAAAAPGRRCRIPEGQAGWGDKATRLPILEGLSFSGRLGGIDVTLLR